MRILYYENGLIRKLYDEALHNHESIPSLPVTDDEALNITLYRVNPNTLTLYLAPTCDPKYIRVVDNVFIEMTAPEKANVDAAEAAEAARVAAKVQALMDNLPSWSSVNTAIDGIANLADAKAFIKKLTRVVYWDVKNSAT